MSSTRRLSQLLVNLRPTCNSNVRRSYSMSLLPSEIETMKLFNMKTAYNLGLLSGSKEEADKTFEMMRKNIQSLREEESSEKQKIESEMKPAMR